MTETTEPAEIMRIAVGAVLFVVQSYTVAQALLTLRALQMLKASPAHRRLAWRGVRDAMAGGLYSALLISSGLLLTYLPPAYQGRWEHEVADWGWVLGGCVAIINGLLAEADRRYLERDREESVRPDDER